MPPPEISDTDYGGSNPPRAVVTKGVGRAFYGRIDGETESGRRISGGLLKLKDALEERILRRTMAGTLLLATWNIREFDSTKYG